MLDNLNEKIDTVIAYSIIILAMLFSISIINGSIKIINKTISEDIYPIDTSNIKHIERKNDYIGKASWYNYNLNGEKWSKTRRTCASREIVQYLVEIIYGPRTLAFQAAFFKSF